MKYLDSNNFKITVNRVSGLTELGINGKVQCVVSIFKGDIELTATNNTPAEGQFKVTISKTTGCSANYKDAKTIYATALTENKGTIVLSINVENKHTFTKNVVLYKSTAVTEVTDLQTRIKIAEEKITTDAIINTVKSDFFTKDQIRSDFTEMKQTIDTWGIRIVENSDEISSLKLTTDSFELKLADKADSSNIIAMINASEEGLTIQSSKINIQGFVTFSDLSTSGETIINGNNITTGFISGDRIKGGTLTATEEIQFEGGARIFGNAGEHGAGLSISAAGFNFSGGSINHLSGNWNVYDGEFYVEEGLTVNTGGIEVNAGGLTINNGAVSLSVNSPIYGYAANLSSITCTSLTSSGAISGPGSTVLNRAYAYAPNGSKYRDYLRLGSLLIQADSDFDGFLITDTSGNYASMAMKRAEVTGDVICNNVWASTKVYAANVALTSDERLKTDIRYVDNDIQTIGENGLMSPNVNITTKDMHAFIEVLPLASYRMKEEVASDIDYTYYGFIAQDVLYSKVGSELIEYGEVVVKNVEYDLKGRPHISYSKEERLRYSENKFIAFLAGALKEEIYQRKELERKMDELYEIVGEISNL